MALLQSLHTLPNKKNDTWGEIKGDNTLATTPQLLICPWIDAHKPVVVKGLKLHDRGGVCVKVDGRCRWMDGWRVFVGGIA